MQGLALIVLLVAAASAFPTEKFYSCIPYLSDHSIIFKEKTYLCDTYDGRRFLVAKDNDWDSYTDDFVVLKNARTIPFLGGGGSGALSGAQSSAGSLSGGIGGGLLPFSLTGSVSGAQSSAGSIAGGGGGGLGYLG